MSTKMMGAVALTALFAVSAFAQTADELVAKSLQAQGGADKMKAMQSVKMSGKMKMGPMEAPFSIVKARPDEMRMEFTIQGMTGIQAFDGTTGWMVMPFQGKKDPEAIGEDDRKELAEQADIDGPLLNYKEKGNKVELVGKEQVEGTDAYKLKITLKNGSVRYYYLDADTYLDIKQEGKRKMRGTEIDGETVYACTTRLEPRAMALEPLGKKDLVRDLVTEIAPPQERFR